jgi:hypothetical protein
MDQQLIRDFYEARGFGAKERDSAITAVQDYERFLARRGKTLETSDVGSMKSYLASLVGSGHNGDDRLLALARYSYLTDRTDVYIYFTSILGIKDIVSNLADRVESVAGPEVRRRVFGELEIPPAGSPPERMPAMTREMVKALQRELSERDVKDALTGNMHGIPAESFQSELELFQKAETIDDYLSDYHQRMVETLQKHANDGTVWFEQRITQAVVDYVKREPEVLGGVRDGDTIWITKIPYDPDAWLTETDPVRKRYLACHCPLARASLGSGGEAVQPVWCNCSAGFAKLKFDVLFGEEVKAEVVENVLEGSDRCRFTVKVPDRFLPEK